MTSPTPSEQSASKKKRPGRKRLPPLAPGPNIQFVVASHPDDFKADETMRHVRSHVMYKHRSLEQRGKSPRRRAQSSDRDATGGALTRKSSPMTRPSERYLNPNTGEEHGGALWEDGYHIPQSSQMSPVHNLAGRILSTTEVEQARSAPPIFAASEELAIAGNSSSTADPLYDLKSLYMDLSENFYGDRAWMETICDSTMSFLSHVSITCVYQDLVDGSLDDSHLTKEAKTRVLGMVNDSFRRLDTQPDDLTILTLIHLLVSAATGFDAEVSVHQDGLARMVHQRGGINTLGLNGSLSSVLTVVMLCFSILRGLDEPLLLHEFVPPPRPSDHIPLLSPLYCPEGDMSGIFATPFCSNDTYSIVWDMHELTQAFVLRWGYVGSGYPSRATTDSAAYEAHMQQIYTNLLLRPSKVDHSEDWIYESCRLTALIYCRSIVQGVPLSESANIVCARTSTTELDPGNFLPHNPGDTVIIALHDALENTERSGCWGELAGVYLWICLVGAAASWRPLPTLYGETDEARLRSALVRKSFALHAVKAALVLGFERPATVVNSQRTMLQVQHLINIKRGIHSQ